MNLRAGAGTIDDRRWSRSFLGTAAYFATVSSTLFSTFYLRLFLTLFLTCLWTGAAFYTAPAHAVETVEEKYDNGQLKLKYEHVNGKKVGLYLEFYENGKPRIQARYKNDKLEGKHVTYYENGEPKIEAGYKRGKLHGKYTETDEDGAPIEKASYVADTLHGKRILFEDGQAVSTQEWKRGELSALNGHRAHSRSRAQIESALKKIYATRVTMPEATKDQAMALRRLNAYRYLCGLPADVKLDSKETKYSQAAADILAKIGKDITHTPENPGLPAAEYKIAATGAASSNLALQAMSSAGSVDMYMHDSDQRNIKLLGHRMWCLSRTMASTGFGRANNKYYAMFAMDKRRKPNNSWKMVRFPPAGYVPVDYFRNGGDAYAWSVALNPRHFKYSEDFEVEIFPLDDELVRGEPLTIRRKHLADPDEHFAAHGGEGDKGSSGKKRQGTSRSRSGKGRKRSGLAGYMHWLVFQPEGLEAEAGRRYWARIRGIKNAIGQPATIEYLVEFIDPVEGATIGGPNGDPNEGHEKRRPKSKSRR